MPSVFDSLISQLSRKDYDRLIAEAHKLRPGTEGRIPYRYRVIALGFALGYDLEQVNQRLQQGGEDKLYARNYIEATLIYAFAHRLSYDRWA